MSPVPPTLNNTLGGASLLMAAGAAAEYAIHPGSTRLLYAAIAILLLFVNVWRARQRGMRTLLRTDLPDGGYAVAGPMSSTPAQGKGWPVNEKQQMAERPI